MKRNIVPPGPQLRGRMVIFCDTGISLQGLTVLVGAGGGVFVGGMGAGVAVGGMGAGVAVGGVCLSL